MKFLAIDYGQRRIGIAASDPTGTVVRGVTTIDRKVCENLNKTLQTILEEERPEKLIVGLPLDHNDEETDMCKEIRKFIIKLTEKLSITIPVDFQDESFSSVRTQQLMIKSSSRKKRSKKGNIDRIAACIILEDYIRESSGSLLLY